MHVHSWIPGVSQMHKAASYMIQPYKLVLRGSNSYQFQISIIHSEIMETKVVRATLVLTVMLFFLVGQSSADIKSCYHCCYDKCRVDGNGKVFCGYRCSLECASIPVPTCPYPPLQDESNCSFACAKSSCGHINPGKQKMRLLAS